MSQEHNHIPTWMQSGEYKAKLSVALTTIMRNSEASQSEQTTATTFEHEIDAIIRKYTTSVIKWNKEVRVDGIEHTIGNRRQTSSGRGRLDAMVNQLVIEYKHHSRLTTIEQKDKAYAQVADYLVAMHSLQRRKASAILTDGIQIAYFSFVGDKVRHTTLRTLNIDDLDTIIKAILSNDLKAFEPTNIVADFSISPVTDSASKQLAYALYHSLCKHCTEKTKMLLAEWEELTHLSANDNGKSRDIEKRRNDLSDIFGQDIATPLAEYQALFALQTTYAVIVKLIACKVVDTINFNDSTSSYKDLLSLSSGSLRSFFEQMEDGYSYNNMNICNFLEGDFFSWYADERQWSREFFDAVKQLLKVIDQYSAFSIHVTYHPIDIFKDLYMSIIPQSVRHSMGEYFTPGWLADCVVSRTLELTGKTDWRAIDPCCGSGIFLIELIKKVVGNVPILDMSAEEKKRLQARILHRVHGIDINPLSVLSARVSYYLALRQLGEVKDVEIPVYLGDSAIIPEKKDMDGIPCYSYTVSNLKQTPLHIILPTRLVGDPSFAHIMSEMQALVRTDQPELLFQAIGNKLTATEKASKGLLASLRQLSEQLVYLHRQQWDGIWIRICTNFMQIARLGNMDMIVGNPPWVKWEHLPSAYAKRIKDFCDVRHIFCNDGGMFGGAQLNICALISNVTATNWLSPGGVLAFLMPDSIMSQNSYEEFRNFYIDESKQHRLYLQELDRWLSPLRPFKAGGKSVTQDFNTYYFKDSPVDYSHGIAVREMRRARGTSEARIDHCYTWEEARQFISIGHSKAQQLSQHSTAFTYTSADYDFKLIIGPTSYLYRTGVESTPFEVFKLLGLGPSGKPGHYRFMNDTRKTARYKVSDTPADGWDFGTDYIYPMVQGPSVKPFTFSCGNSFHIIPYNEDSTARPVPMEQLLARNRELAVYFANHRPLLDSQSEKSKTMHQGDDFYALSKIGPYTFAPYIVAARDNSKFCASVITPTRTPWGEVKPSVCVKHTIIISQDNSHRFITADEAHYINGVLNSGIVVAYIHSTFKTNGFSLNKSHIFLPKYRPGQALFEHIAALSKQATANPATADVVGRKLTEAYLDLCRALNPTLQHD